MATRRPVSWAQSLHVFVGGGRNLFFWVGGGERERALEFFFSSARFYLLGPMFVFS